MEYDSFPQVEFDGSFLMLKELSGLKFASPDLDTNISFPLRRLAGVLPEALKQRIRPVLDVNQSLGLRR